MLNLDPKRSLVRKYHDCRIVSVHLDHARELRGEDPHVGDLPDGHDGWEHTVFRGAHPIGTFTNLGAAIEAARLTKEQPERASPANPQDAAPPQSPQPSNNVPPEPAEPKKPIPDQAADSLPAGSPDAPGQKLETLLENSQ